MHTNKIIIGIIQYNHSIEYWNVIVKSNISWEDPPISASFSNRNPPSKKSHLHLSARQMILQHTGLLFANDFIMNHKKVAINALEIEFDSESESSETNHKSHQRSTLKIHLMVSKWKIFMIHFLNALNIDLAEFIYTWTLCGWKYDRKSENAPVGLSSLLWA